MKSRYQFFVVLFMTLSAMVVQANNLPISVSANENVTVTLFFPTEIKKVIKPAVNYKFEFEQNGMMATLVARKGASSNLTVITKCGSIFSFRLEYKAAVDNFTYVLSAEQAIGKLENSGAVSVNAPSPTLDSTTNKPERVIPEVISIDEAPEKAAFKPSSADVNVKPARFAADVDTQDTTPSKKGNSLYETDSETYYQIFCENNYDQDPRFKKPIIAGSGVTLQLNTLAADKNELYFVLEVNNTLDADFKTDDIGFYVRTGQNDAPLTMTPLYVFNAPEVLGPNEKKNMVYVFKEFKLSNEQTMFIEMNEKSGTKRTIMLKVNSQTINRANN